MKKHATSPIQFAPALLTAVALIACSSIALGQSANQDQKTVPSLKLPAAPAPSKGTLDASGTMPSAEEIFAKAVAASGGADLIRMQTARTQTGTIEMPAQSLKGTIVTKSVDPSMLLIETEIPGFGKIRQGANGTTGWSIDPMRGASIMSPEELKRVQHRSGTESCDGMRYSNCRRKNHFCGGSLLSSQIEVRRRRIDTFLQHRIRAHGWLISQSKYADG